MQLLLQSESDIGTSSVIERLFWPITGHAIAIQYPDLDIGPYRVAIYVHYWHFPVIRQSVLFKNSFSKCH
jgi:hypothetical protein